MKTISFFIFIFFSTDIFSKAIYVPVPSLPKNFQVDEANDVYSINLNFQIHKSLFRIDKHNIPVPDIVKNFDISIDGTTYTFELNDFKFHDNSKLTSEDVVISLKQVFKKNVVGTSRFSCIQGSENNSYSGIYKLDDNRFRIKMKCKNHKFIHQLADIRTSIFKPAYPKIGLGNFKILNINEDEIVLESITGDTKIHYIKDSNEELLKSLINKKKHIALFMSKRLSLKYKNDTYFKWKDTLTTKSFNLHVISNTVKSLFDRKQILSSINREYLLQICYKQGYRISNNFIPFGFLGYSPNILLPSYTQKNKYILKNKLNVGILMGTGSESCVKDYINMQLAKIAKIVNTEIIDSSVAASMLATEKIDILYMYIESDHGSELISYFDYSPDFPVGNKNNKRLSMLYKKIKTSKDLIAKYKIGEEISKEILDDYLLRPLFSAEEFIVYSKNIIVENNSIYSPTYINFGDIKFINE